MERQLTIADSNDRANLLAFARRCLRLDDTAVLRLRSRGDDLVIAWVQTGFDVLAARTIRGLINPADASVDARALAEGLASDDAAIDLGYSLDSAWRSGLPPEDGWTHVDDLPAAVIAGLADKGAAATTEAGSVGPPKSLLDQVVLNVESDGEAAEVRMRAVFALRSMGFVPDNATADEIVRVRLNRRWVRLDARFGSVAFQTGGLAVLA